MAEPDPTDPIDKQRAKQAARDLKAAAAHVGKKDIGPGGEHEQPTEAGATFKRALGEFWKSRVEPKGSDGPKRRRKP